MKLLSSMFSIVASVAKQDLTMQPTALPQRLIVPGHTQLFLGKMIMVITKVSRMKATVTTSTSTSTISKTVDLDLRPKMKIPPKLASS
jgi:hypothetical protein